MKLSSWRVVWLMAGSVLGAGFVSGQEIWQFFGRFGMWGVVGLVLALALFTVLGIVILDTANILGTEKADEIILPVKSKFLTNAIYILQVLFMFGLVTIMLAGVGELLTEFTGLPKWTMCLIATVVTVAIAAAGLEGVVNVFGFCVPIIVLVSIIFAVISMFAFDGTPDPGVIEDNSFIPNWGAAALTYASYNMFSAIGILCPFGRRIKNKRALISGGIFGGAVLLVISGSILIAMNMYPESAYYAMPMLALAEKISPWASVCYGALLLFGLLQTSISSLVAANTYILARNDGLKKHKILLTVIFGGLTFAFSMFGFGEMVGTVYPVFGYISIFFVAGMLAKNRILKIKSKSA